MPLYRQLKRNLIRLIYNISPKYTTVLLLFNVKRSEYLRVYRISSIKSNADKAGKYKLYRYIRIYKKTKLEVIIIYDNKNIIELLSDLADEEENYYSLMNGTNDNSVYELVIRLFSKIPFLQYRFKATSDDISLEKMVKDALDDNLIKYDEAIRENRNNIAELIDLEKEEFREEEIEKIFDEIMKEVE